MCNTVFMRRERQDAGWIEHFNRWLNWELAKRGWSEYQLAKVAGVTPAVISRARAGTLPKWEACVKLAKGLDYPAEVVFREAGLLPDDPTSDPQLEQLIILFNQADAHQRECILSFTRYILSR
ncbi:MAG: helix-turn-helix domain-containing protein [Bellilinea sp.]